MIEEFLQSWLDHGSLPTPKFMADLLWMKQKGRINDSGMKRAMEYSMRNRLEIMNKIQELV